MAASFSETLKKHKWPILAGVGGLGAVYYLATRASANTVGAPTGTSAAPTGSQSPGAGMTEYQSAQLGLQQQAMSNALTLGLGGLQNQRDIAAAQIASADERAQLQQQSSLANTASGTLGNILKALTGGGGGSSGSSSGSGGGSRNDQYSGINQDANMQPQPYLDALAKWDPEGDLAKYGGGYGFTSSDFVGPVLTNANPEIYGTEGYYDPNSYGATSPGDVNPPDFWGGD